MTSKTISHSLPLEYLPDAERHYSCRSISRNITKWKNGLPYELQYSLGAYFDYNFRWIFSAGEVYAQLKPLFEDALADREISAWVAANDLVAAFALDFLARRKIPVPQRLSIVGFDNSIRALSAQITSYDFDIPGVVQHMLRFIVSGSQPALTSGRMYSHVQGQIVERQTTGRRPEIRARA